MQTPCLLHKGHIDKDGYGKDSRGRPAHREVYRAHYKVKLLSMRGLVVRHTCDTRACINPEHLVLGTQKENIDDMIAKGRKFYGKGETAPNRKLTDAQVTEIRASNLSVIAIAHIYGLSRGYVYEILKFKTWSHLS